MSTAPVRLGIIGGSGLYHMAGLTDIERVEIVTPFGFPSDAITVGILAGERIAFLPRHGQGHRYSPTTIPARANIWALKSLGVEWLISVSAVGSLREEIAPLDLVIPDQIVDRTRSRVNTFFDEGVVVHCSLADPFCPSLSAVIAGVAQESGAARVHQGGMYLCMEGPLFSTRAESNLIASGGMDIIGMTALPEAKLAREAEICYAIIACVTDYDSWHATAESVSVELVVANLQRNIVAAQGVIHSVVGRLPARDACECSHALAHAVITDRAAIASEARERFALLLDPYL